MPTEVGYRRYLSSEDHGFATIQIPVGVPAMIVNIGEEEAHLLNLSSPEWRPDDQDEHPVSFDDYDPGGPGDASRIHASSQTRGWEPRPRSMARRSDQMANTSQKTMDAEGLSDEIQRRLHRLGSFDAQSLRSVRRVVSKELAGAPPKLVISVAEHLLETPSFASRVIAYELILYHPEALRALRAPDLERLGKGIDSWEAVDTFACYVAGPAWRERQIPNRVIHAWARSQDRWWRRAALVSTVPLNNKTRGGQGDAQRTLRALTSSSRLEWVHPRISLNGFLFLPGFQSGSPGMPSSILESRLIGSSVFVNR